MSVGLVTPAQSSQAPSATVVGKWADGTPLNIAQQVSTYRAASAVSEGQLVRVATPSAGDVPGVEPVPAVATNRTIGVALNAAAAGDIVRVARDVGWVRVGTATSLATARSVRLDASTAGTLQDNGTEASPTAAAAEIGVARSAVVTNFYGSTSAILVEFT